MQADMHMINRDFVPNTRPLRPHGYPYDYGHVNADRQFYVAVYPEAWNGSYQGFTPHTISCIYRECYHEKLSVWHWHEVDEGRFFSRFDKFPYWCRDMLAFRAAKMRAEPWIRAANAVKCCFLFKQVWFVNKVQQFVDWLYLSDFKPSMRHMWDIRRRN